MQPIINSSGVLGAAIVSFTTNFTGSLTLTLISLFVLLVCIGLGLRMAPELTAIVLIPFIIGAMIYIPQFRIIGGVIIVILAALGVKNWFF